MNTQNLYLPVSNEYKISPVAGNIFIRFIQWCQSKEYNRLAWTGIILTSQGCVITPVTLFFVIVSGMNPVLLSLACFSIMINLVVNLAAMPTRITIPVYVLSLLVSAVVITASFSEGVDLSRVF